MNNKKLASACCHRAGCGGGAHNSAHNHDQSAGADASLEAPNIYRLPRTVVPSHYDMTISPDGKSRLFHGEVAITVDVLKATSTVKLNAKNLVVTSAIARHASGTTLVAVVIDDAEKEMVELKFDGKLAASTWVLELQFAGQHGGNSQGFFATTWSDSDKVEHTMLCTQFESADARSAFPCFDEPDFKAVFKVRLVVANELTALSNGDIVSVTPSAERGKKVVEFEPTLKMSTYVVCFVVGELKHSEPFYVNGKRLQIWCVPGCENQTRFAMEASAFGLDYFERYFGVPYPFGNKIDLVAVPDFAWGGMENVGLIVFQPRLLLVDESRPGNKEGVCQIIMHELAHQWFGDLVTMRWWNGLWLNESFATFMQYKAADAFNSEWHCWDGFGHKRNLAYWTDSVRTSHPIEETVERGGDAIFLVDPISYEKGCSVLYQTEGLLGDEVLRQGINLYLEKHAFGNTESFDLWDSLEAACKANSLDIPIRSIMEAWIFQVGHPEVIVTTGKLKSRPGEIVLTQRPFLLLERGRKARKLWPIPIVMEVTDGAGAVKRESFVLSERTRRVQVGEYTQVKVNAGGRGFYRVRYAPELLKLLTDKIDSLGGIELLNLIADAKAMFTACLMDAPDYMEFLFTVASRDDTFSWHCVMEGLDRVSRLCDEKDRALLTRLIAGRLRELAEVKGWNVSKTSEAVLPLLSEFKPYHLNLTPIVQKLSRVFLRAWRKDPTSVEPLKAAQAAMVLHFGRVRLPEEFSALQRQAMHATPLDLQRYISELVERNATTASAPDFYDVVAGIITHPGRSSETVVQQFLQEWPENVKGDTPAIQVIYAVQYGGLSDVDEARLEGRLKRCFQKYKYRQADPVIRRTMERVRANVVMREKQGPAITAALKRMVKTLRLAKPKRKIKLF